MKTITSIILLLSLVIPNSASTNRTDPFNKEHNLFTRENIKNIVNVFVTCTEQIPLNEIAAILEDYMNTEEDIKDFMDSTINGDDFHRILRFSKTYYERLLTPIWEIVSVISEKPAMQPMKEAQKIISKLFEAVESANLNLEEITNILTKGRVIEMQETIKKVSQDKLLKDQDFLNLINFVNDEVIVTAWRRLQKRIMRNEDLKRVVPRYLENGFFSIVRDFYEKILKYGVLKGLTEKHKITLPEKIENKFLSDVMKMTAMMFLYVETDEFINEFINYVKTDEFQRLLGRAFAKVVAEEGGQSFFRDEL